VPDSTFELRVRWQLRLDQLTRNLLDLPHRGYALGADAVWGWRADSDAWGLPGTEFHSGDEGRDYVQATGYVFAIGDLPFVASERWRLFGSAHGGAGSGVDRFSAQRVGGGPICAARSSAPRRGRCCRAPRSASSFPSTTRSAASACDPS
jgi:hypothetical protein